MNYGMEFRGQKDQDKWVVEEAMPGRRGGYFLDLAAADGATGSNTIFLERELGWSGVAIEPNDDAFIKLKRRRACKCVKAVIDETARVVSFLPNGQLGGIIDTDTDNSPEKRGDLIEEWEKDKKIQIVKTKTLYEVLLEVQAPRIIDYFSFDVEGAETRIIRSFPFNMYKFMSLTIERPTPEINELLFSNGYVFVKNHKFDTFYVHESNDICKTIKLENFEQIPPKMK